MSGLIELESVVIGKRCFVILDSLDGERSDDIECDSTDSERSFVIECDSSDDDTSSDTSSDSDRSDTSSDSNSNAIPGIVTNPNKACETIRPGLPHRGLSQTQIYICGR